MTNNAAAVSFVGFAVEALQSSFRGTFIQGAAVTPDDVYEDKSIREWLEVLRRDIDQFLR